jgi:hypothetical protein
MKGKKYTLKEFLALDTSKFYKPVKAEPPPKQRVVNEAHTGPQWKEYVLTHPRRHNFKELIDKVDESDPTAYYVLAHVIAVCW